MRTNQTIHTSEEELKKIELKSEELKELLGTMPHWTIRSGATYLLLLTIAVFTGLWFIRYPDVIHAPILLTTPTPPASIIANNSGYLNLWVKDKQAIQKGVYIGYLTNTADANAVIELKKHMDSFAISLNQSVDFLDTYKAINTQSFGELQDSYNAFLNTVHEYQLASRQNTIEQQISATKKQITQYKQLLSQTDEKNAIMEKELQLAGERFKMDSVLNENKVYSKAEYIDKKKDVLQIQRDYKTLLLNSSDNKIKLTQLETKVRELQLQKQNQLHTQLLAIEATLHQLVSRIEWWEQTYMLKATISGTISFFKYWADQQFIQAKEEILTIIPNDNQYFGQAKVATAGSGKLKEGQRVNIKFDNYPVEEYGMVAGRVRNISLLPREKAYLVIIDLPNRTTTSYGKQLIFSQEMTGQAEIITEELRLLERFFYKIKDIFSR